MHRPARHRRRLSLALVAHLLLIVSLACVLNPTTEPGIPTPTNAQQGGPTATVTPLPKPTLTPAPEGLRVTLSADGSGDYASLEEAVRGVPPGSIITLNPGTYRLGASLTIDKQLTLIGAGVDATEIVGSAGQAAVTVTGESFTARDLTIRYDGTGVADALRVEQGQIMIERSRFTGAGHQTGERASAGLNLLGSTRGDVISSEAVGNALDGIRVVDQARVTLAGNVCSDNGQTGILFRDDAAGIASDNTCERNTLSGILVTGAASPVLSNNTLRANTESGIAYFGTSGGEARGNTATNNGLHGISISGSAAPSVQNNTCSENAQNGIGYFESGAGSAVGNTCRANDLHGIAVNGDATPELRDNQISDNAEAGIRLAERSAATVVGNVCRGNGLSGFIIRDEATPILMDNLSESNDETGFVWFGSAGGQAENNRSVGNGLHGFDFYGSAAPYLEGNTAEANTEVGIRVTNETTPYLLGNTAFGNGLAGFVARDGAQPTVEGNTFRDNTESGAAFFGTSSGLFTYNEAIGNGLNGVNVTDQATPVIERNTMTNNAESGLAFFREATGVAQANTISGNKWGIYVESGANPALGDNDVYGNDTDIDDRRPPNQPRPVVPPLSAGGPPNLDVVSQPVNTSTVQLFDDFSNPHSGWQLGSDANGRVWVERDELRLRNETAGSYATHTEPGLWLAATVVEVDTRLVGGTDNNWIDVMCRRQNEDEYYIAGYSSDGFVKARAFYAGEEIYYVDIKLSDAILTAPGATNRLRLSCIGSRIRFWVNETLVADFTDSVLTEGDVGLAVSALDGDYSDVAFDNFRVTQGE
jgi:parallel beta-helix repeat protein